MEGGTVNWGTVHGSSAVCLLRGHFSLRFPAQNSVCVCVISHKCQNKIHVCFVHIINTAWLLRIQNITFNHFVVFRNSLFLLGMFWNILGLGAFVCLLSSDVSVGIFYWMPILLRLPCFSNAAPPTSTRLSGGWQVHCECRFRMSQ
jgi:hypothetical protein